MQSYASAGVTEYDRVRIAQPVVLTGSNSATNGDGDFHLLSNPAQAATTSFFGNGAVGTFGSNWQCWHENTGQNASSAIVEPPVNINEQPVMRVGRRSSNVMTQQVCGMFVCIEYVQGDQPPPPHVLLGEGAA
jgi:hypothetical protein